MAEVKKTIQTRIFNFITFVFVQKKIAGQRKKMFGKNLSEKKNLG